jgi:1-acyl-sn-glycerol-3-phosphate acyltransferase
MTAPKGRWHPETEMQPPAPRGLGWLRLALRLPVLALLLFGGLAIFLTLRGGERLMVGQRRPLSGYVAQFCCGYSLAVLGMRYRSQGAPMRHPGAFVSNHSSWLDIYALFRRDRVFFVSKAEVARWPGVGLLARAVGTVFISRDPRQAEAQRQVFDARLRLGHRLVFFPEGTSTDGSLVLPFKSTLFAAFFAEGLRARLWVQPVSVRYHAPEGADPRFYNWFGAMTFAPHLLSLLAAPRHGGVEVIYHPPLRVADFADRKALARACEAAVRSGLRDPAESPR